MMELAQIHVALVEDDPLTRERLAFALNAHEQIDLCFMAANAMEMLSWLRHDPAAKLLNVLLVDLGLPDYSGLEVISQATQLLPHVEVMVITLFGDEAHMIRAFEAGAKGYLLKDTANDDLIAHVLNLHAGGSPMSPVIARQLLARMKSTATSSANDNTQAVVPNANHLADKLTPRETEILSLLSRGYTYPELARLLGLTVSTVQSHVKNIYSKLAVHTKTEAVFEARQLGLLGK